MSKLSPGWNVKTRKGSRPIRQSDIESLKSQFWDDNTRRERVHNVLAAAGIDRRSIPKDLSEVAGLVGVSPAATWREFDRGVKVYAAKYAIEVSRRAAHSTQSAAADLPALSDTAAAVYELLKGLPSHRSLTGPKILEALDAKKIHIDQSTLTKRIIPALAAYGVENTKRIGYRIRQSARPAN